MRNEPRGRLAEARRAEGFTQESLAYEAGVTRETVSHWEAGDWIPSAWVRPKLARALRRSLRELDELFVPQSPRTTPTIGHNLEEACVWLDAHASWASGTSRQKLLSRLERAQQSRVRAHDAERGNIARELVVEALQGYYGNPPLYHAYFEDTEIRLAIFSKPEWLGLNCALSYNNDRFKVVSGVMDDTAQLDAVAADHAIRRLVEAAIFDVTLVNSPLYRMQSLNVSRGRGIEGELSVVPFVQYALTSDLLETELIDQLIKSKSLRRQIELPIRDRHMSDVPSVFDVANRSCSGGVLALFAIARPEDPNRGPEDFVLLTQERGQQVLNGAGKVSVIPRGFHQPLRDFRADALIGATLRRELEEELFHRADVDNTISDGRIADPMHPSRLSEPMKWLMGHPEGVRIECTGFGFNGLNGNYEFACLVVIDDPEFWIRYGGHIEANWESTGLRQYSTRDRGGIRDLMRERAWSNEGLFALIEGLRRLREIDDTRVDLSPIQVSISV